MANETKQTVEMTARVKVFGQVGNHRLRVHVAGGMVGVWDSIAGHYTTCHSISQRVQARILRAAADQQQAEIDRATRPARVAMMNRWNAEANQGGAR